MLTTILLILFFFLTPVLLIYLCRISRTVNKIGAIVLAYALGLIIGNIGIFPTASDSYKKILGSKDSVPTEEIQQYYQDGQVTDDDLIFNQIRGAQTTVFNISILLSIPLLLFSLDIKKWLKLARGAVLSMILGLVSLFIVIIIGYVLFKDRIPESWKVAGMLVGVYTGGSFNLSAIGTALDVTPNTFILTNTYDIVLGSIALFFLLTIAQRVFNLILPTFDERHKHLLKVEVSKEAHGMDDYTGMLTKKGIPPLALTVAIAIIIVGVSYAIGMLVPKNAQTTVIVLALTTFGIIGSMIKFISRIEKSFQLGMYLIIVFSLAVASMGDLRGMFQLDYVYLFIYVAIAIFGSMIVHVGLSWIFKVDTDSTIITITALTYSPPFVPVVSGALKNKEVIISGLAVGIFGWAMGNYFGISIAYLLQRLFG